MPVPAHLSTLWRNVDELRAQSQYAAARDLLEPAAEVAVMTYGPDEPCVIETLHRLATVHREMGELPAARRVLEEALDGGLMRLGDADPMLLAISAELGAIADELGNRHEARRNLARVAKYGPAVLGADHPYVRTAQRYLGIQAAIPTGAPTTPADPEAPPAGVVSSAGDPSRTEGPGAPRLPDRPPAPEQSRREQPRSEQSRREQPRPEQPRLEQSGPGQLSPGTAGAAPLQAGAAEARSRAASDPGATGPRGRSGAGDPTTPRTASAGTPSSGTQAPLYQPIQEEPGVYRPASHGRQAAGPRLPGQPSGARQAGTQPTGRPPSGTQSTRTPATGTVPTSGPPSGNGAPESIPPAPGQRRQPASSGVTGSLLPPDLYAEPEGYHAPLHEWREESRRTRVSVIVLTSIAVVAVLGIGIALAFTLGQNGSTPDRTAGRAPTSASPSSVAPSRAAPTSVRLRDQGTSVTLTWADPTGGTVPFIVAGGRAGQQSRAFQSLPAGQTAYTVEGLNPTADYCFTVVAVYTTDTVAPSDLTCTQRHSSATPAPSR